MPTSTPRSTSQLVSTWIIPPERSALCVKAFMTFVFDYIAVLSYYDSCISVVTVGYDIALVSLRLLLIGQV